jgi:hypothetical protein
MGFEIFNSGESATNFHWLTACRSSRSAQFRSQAFFQNNFLVTQIWPPMVLYEQMQKAFLVTEISVSATYEATAFLGKRGCVLLALSDVQRQSAGPDFGLIDGKLSHGGFAGNLLKLLRKRKPGKASHPLPSRRCRTSLGGAGFCFLAPTNFSFSLLGRIRLAAIEGVCGANAFVMIGSRVWSRIV